MTVYNDDYPTCARTYATLCVYTGAVNVDVVTERLGLQPSSTRAGLAAADTSSANVRRGNGFWSFSSKGEVNSLDVRRHLDWLLSILHERTAALDELRALSVEMVVSCYWASRNGHGGPQLDPLQTRALAELDLAVWFDVYFPSS